jgi:hypothetical protein
MRDGRNLVPRIVARLNQLLWVAVVLGWLQSGGSPPLMAQRGTPTAVADSIDRRMSEFVKLDHQPDCRSFEDSIPDYAVSARACLNSGGDTITYWYLTPDDRFAAAGRQVTAGVNKILALTNEWLGAWSSELGPPVMCQIDGFRIGPPIKQYFLWRRNAYVVRLITTAGDSRRPIGGPDYIEVQIVRQRPRTGGCAAWLQMPAWE